MKAPACEREWHNALMSDRERGYAHRVDIRVDVQQVWRALTETEQLTRWCSPAADISARKGGLMSAAGEHQRVRDRKSTRLNSSHDQISYAVFCLKKKK